MAFITGPHIPRRTMLRGLGATIALPFLDAMAPARALWSRTAHAASLDRTRLVCIGMVHGSAGSSDWGASPPLWSPAATRREFAPAPSSLGPLEPFRKHLTIVRDPDRRP